MFTIMNLTKTNTRLIGSAFTMQSLVDMMQNRMYWNVVRVQPSETHVYGRKPVFDVYTTKGRNDYVVIVYENRRYKLYMILTS